MVFIKKQAMGSANLRSAFQIPYSDPFRQWATVRLREYIVYIVKGFLLKLDIVVMQI